MSNVRPKISTYRAGRDLKKKEKKRKGPCGNASTAARYVYACMYIHTYIHTYIHIERERYGEHTAAVVKWDLKKKQTHVAKASTAARYGAHAASVVKRAYPSSKRDTPEW